MRPECIRNFSIGGAYSAYTVTCGRVETRFTVRASPWVQSSVSATESFQHASSLLYARTGGIIDSAYNERWLCGICAGNPSLSYLFMREQLELSHCKKKFAIFYYFGRNSCMVKQVILAILFSFRFPLIVPWKSLCRMWVSSHVLRVNFLKFVGNFYLSQTQI